MENVLSELIQIEGGIDTIASIAGQVAGVRLGLSGLPAHLVALDCVQGILPTIIQFVEQEALLHTKIK